MKNLKLLVWSIIGMVLAAPMVLAQAGDASCSINGEAVDCAEFWNSPFAKLFLGGGFLLLLLFLVMGIFWLVMLINAIAEPIDNKALWIAMIFFFGPLAALVYYIVVVRERKKGNTMMPPSAISVGRNSTPPAGTTNFK